MEMKKNFRSCTTTVVLSLACIIYYVKLSFFRSPLQTPIDAAEPEYLPIRGSNATILPINDNDDDADSRNMSPNDRSFVPASTADRMEQDLDMVRGRSNDVFTQQSNRIMNDASLIPLVKENYGEDIVQPMWSCTNTSLNRDVHKLVFVHVFKTAGSSMRKLLRVYNHHCQANLALVVGCSGLDRDTMSNDTIWRSHDNGVPCRLKEARRANSKRIPSNGTISTSYLEEHDINILGGHLPLGSHVGWRDRTLQHHVQTLSLTFFRNAIDKFVSGMLFVDKGRSNFEEIVQKIKQRVTEGRRSNSYYERYTKYLLTPAQTAHFRQHQHPSMEERVSLTMKNLVQSKILIGIVERMSDSLQLLRHVLDKDDDLLPAFELFGMKNENGTESRTIKANKAPKHSTHKVIAELEKDEEFMVLFHEYVKYDHIIHQFALQLHKRQVEAMMRNSDYKQ